MPKAIDGRKQCPKCKIIKDVSEFAPHIRNFDKLRYRCKECCIADGRLYYRKNRQEILCKSRNRNHYRAEWTKEQKQSRSRRQCAREAGITEKEYLEMFRKQNGKCVICGVSHLELSLQLAIDHDHKTGRVRGLLCGQCNTMLGLAKENIQVLINAISYLKHHSEIEAKTKVPDQLRASQRLRIKGSNAL